MSECGDVNFVIELFNNHKGEPFTYLADTQLFKLFSRLEFCRIFEVKANQVTVGGIYPMNYMYNCGWLGGLLVHKNYRRRGIGRKLLKKSLEWLNTTYTYAFVELENIAARNLFEGWASTLSIGDLAIIERKYELRPIVEGAETKPQT